MLGTFNSVLGVTCLLKKKFPFSVLIHVSLALRDEHKMITSLYNSHKDMDGQCSLILLISHIKNAYRSPVPLADFQMHALNASRAFNIVTKRHESTKNYEAMYMSCVASQQK